MIGLGGEGVLRTFGRESEARALIDSAIDLGITYFESARAYSGSESYYGSALGQRRKDIFLTSKSHARDKQGAKVHLQETLTNMQTDYLDLWQVHDVRTQEDVDGIFGEGGAIEAFVEAREKGAVRYIGVTGHHDPHIIKRCIELFDFDTVLIPVNPAEPHLNSFIEEVIPLAVRKEMGIIGMKVYCRGLFSQVPDYRSMEPYLHYALSHPVSTIVIGCDSIRQLEENVAFARSYIKMTEKEIEKLIESAAPYAGQLMYYKPL
jgi:aryl-alcohol dehydrogenase-like predicted oxidoreductase